jgi:hypothetical protein
MWSAILWGKLIFLWVVVVFQVARRPFSYEFQVLLRRGLRLLDDPMQENDFLIDDEVIIDSNDARNLSIDYEGLGKCGLLRDDPISHCASPPLVFCGWSILSNSDSGSEAAGNRRQCLEAELRGTQLESRSGIAIKPPKSSFWGIFLCGEVAGVRAI